jgi:APA family basic amino acid/polyamine antiporter
MTVETKPALVAADDTNDLEFVKGLGLTSSTMLVMGSMIGSGIFLVSAEIAREVDSPALLIGAWLVTAFMTIVAALSYGELAAMMPRAGGQYVYLREALGPLWGFLYGWTLFLVIQTGTIAAVGVAFGKFLGVFFPSISASHWIGGLHWVAPKWHIGPMMLGGMDVGLNTQNLMAILLVLVLSIINVFGVKTGALIQNVFTFAKVAALLGLVLVGLVEGRNAVAVAANFGANFWRNLHGLHGVQVGVNGPTVLVGALTILAVAQVGSLFSADAWNNVTFTAGEVINPKRNLPLSLALGTGTVLALYVACNVIYLNILPLHGSPNGGSTLAQGIQYASYPDDRVATAAMTLMFGSIGAYLMAAAILVSTFGCNNGLILSGARVYYAMAKDGLFFREAGKLHPTYKTPAVSLMVQMVWICILCLSGTYGQLLDYVVFAVLVFYILTIAGIFVLRRTRPDAPRPYKAFGYPVLPLIYIAMAIFIDIVLLRYKPQFTWPGLIIVLLGIPVYFAWSRRSRAAAV